MNYPVITNKKHTTSDALKSNAKIFLDELITKEHRVKNKTYQIIGSAFSNLRLPMPGEQLRIRTQQQINMLAIILSILKKHKLIEELTIVTYTINRDTFNIISKLLESGKIKMLNLYIASSYSYRDAEYFNELKTTLLNLSKLFDCHLTFAWLHFKITLVKCGESYYHVEGSMNYSQNNMAEQIVFENNKEMYDFDYNMLKEVLSKKNNNALEVIC